MPRITNVYRVFSSQTIDSAGTLTSDVINIERAAYASFHYVLATATTGLYVACTASILLAADKRETFITPVDVDNNDVSLLGQINSNNRFIRINIPLSPYAQVRINSVTNNTITFDTVYLVLDEQ